MRRSAPGLRLWMRGAFAPGATQATLLSRCLKRRATRSSYIRAGLLVVLALYGAKLAAMDVPSAEIGDSLMHYPIVVIHEFGHVLFKPFGEFMHIAGGALTQIGMPSCLAPSCSRRTAIPSLPR